MLLYFTRVYVGNKMIGIKLLEISFSDRGYGVVKVHKNNLHKEIKKYIDKHSIENVFVNNKAYVGDKVDYESTT